MTSTTFAPPSSAPPRRYWASSRVGTASPVLGVITSYQEQIEWHLRLASLLVGLAVGILSLVAMVRKLRRR
ncbi:MAG: hypothetical protein NTW21_15175 [Verrucomicrobia bacterium]|nr:hypothetical protein [Verrucomicrobiota bacterium]